MDINKIYTVEQVKQFEKVDEDLLNAVKNNLPVHDGDGSIDCDVDIKYEGIHYAFVEINSDNEIDEGKYTNGCVYYQLVSYDGKIDNRKYPTEKNIIKHYNLIAVCSYSKSGSYFSDYQYYYDEAQLKELKVVTVPEKIIEEHEEVVVE